KSILPAGSDYTFWGKGVSQGHSDAIRRVPGVKNAVQYTIPRAEALERVRAGENPELSTRDKHRRECFVVLKDGADKKEVEKAIIQMPNYFADYDTTVHFVDEVELAKHHSRMPHGGFVIRSGNTTEDNPSVIEFSLKVDSNPEFTASILVAYARAVYRMYKSGKRGAISVLDVPLGLLSLQDGARLRKELL
ncbi:MAG: diaminopimelate dehydrogenase, partial [SAR324 cluster bacterium]|nr:diaminopimelate dehydrogenase [SAR324 cluster bacterium]